MRSVTSTSRPHWPLIIQIALPVGQIPHLRQRLPLGVPQAHLVQADLELNEAVASGGGLQAGDEPALRVLHRQHAPEELRVRHGPAGQLGHQGLLEPRELRRRRLLGLQAQGQPPGVLSVVSRGVPQDPDPIALPHRHPAVLCAHGEELAALRVGLDRHAWLAAHAPFFISSEKNAVR